METASRKEGIGVSSESWHPDDPVRLPQALGEATAELEPTLARWSVELQGRYPERMSHLVWDGARVRLLEEALDIIAEDDADCPPHLRAFYRRSLINRLTGLGPLDPLLSDDTINEIMVNGETTYVERDGVIEPCAIEFLDAEEVQDLARRIANRAGRDLNTESPLCDARLSDGSRIHCVLPPVSEVPTITIRRAQRRALTRDDYLEHGSMSQTVWDDLVRLVQARRNIIVAGGASTGKTSLLRLLATAIAPQERVVTIEDVRELNISHQNTVSLEAFRQFTVRDLVVNALRMRPDRIIVGEVRGAETLDLIEAMSSGHPGSLCTVHSADGGMRTIHRLARMALQKSVGLAFDSLVAQIMDTIEVIVYLVREPDGLRRVDTIVDVSPRGMVTRWRWNGSDFIRGEIE